MRIYFIELILEHGFGNYSGDKVKADSFIECPHDMLETAVLMTTKSELSEENQVSRLLIHEEPVLHEGMRIETVFPLTCDLCSMKIGVFRLLFFVDKLSIIIDTIEM
jgi:hypothetical protein